MDSVQFLAQSSPTQAPIDPGKRYNNGGLAGAGGVWGTAASPCT